MKKNSSKHVPGLDITLERIKNLRLSHKMALTYTIAFTTLLGITFAIIYFAVENFRRDDFYNRLKNSTLTRYRMFVEVEEIDAEGLKLFDRSIVSSSAERQILLFNSKEELLYNSSDFDDPSYAQTIIRQLKTSNENEIRKQENKVQYVGLQFKYKGRTYYGISKGQDVYGINKLEFLRALLIVSFFIVTGVIVIISFYLSKMITTPVTMLTRDIGEITPDNLSVRVRSPQVRDEVGFLANKFNEMLDKVESAFKFQHHFIHHLSHELKTPLAIMLANLESAMLGKDEAAIKNSLQFQKNALMELANIINAMMDISKSETQLSNVLSDIIRVDELLFECMDEINYLDHNVQFDFVIDDSIQRDENLTVTGSGRMLKMAVMNLLKNAVNYSLVAKPRIALFSTAEHIQVQVLNDGPVIPATDREQLFKHMFRGETSLGTKGFGLGLVLTHRIVLLHKGSVSYHVTDDHLNCFKIQLPFAF